MAVQDDEKNNAIFLSFASQKLNFKGTLDNETPISVSLFRLGRLQKLIYIQKMSLKAKLMETVGLSLLLVWHQSVDQSLLFSATFLTRCFPYCFRPISEKDDFHVCPCV